VVDAQAFLGDEPGDELDPALSATEEHARKTAQPGDCDGENRPPARLTDPEIPRTHFLAPRTVDDEQIRYQDHDHGRDGQAPHPQGNVHCSPPPAGARGLRARTWNNRRSLPPTPERVRTDGTGNTSLCSVMTAPSRQGYSPRVANADPEHTE